MSAQDIKTELIRFGLTPNRALGQNFLCDGDASEAIAAAACMPGLPVLEIGPGLGALTAGLLSRASEVTAVELDEAMVRALKVKFADASNLTLVHGDFLNFDTAQYACDAYKSAGGWCAAGNLPYYITSPICMKLMESAPLPERMTLMLQKEAAARFFAPVGSKLYGPLGVTSMLYYECKPLLSLSPASYYPQPDVESMVITLERRKDAPFEAKLSGLLRAAFAMRRKTLANNLRALGLGREEAAELIRSAGIDANARAEQAPPAQLYELARALNG